MTDLPRIAIVGLGGLYPGADCPQQLWHLLLAARDAASEPPPGRWWLDPATVLQPGEPRPDRVPSCRGCFLAPFSVDVTGLAIDPNLIPQLDPLFRLALACAIPAWHSAQTARLDRSRVGVILASIALPTETTSALSRLVLGRAFYQKHGRPCPWNGDSLPHPLNRQVTGLPARLIAQALQLGGPCYTLDAACASSLYALKLAVDLLQAGRVDAMLTGGISRPDSLYTQMGFAQLRALSPTGRCRPFDNQADGLVVGEGGGVFVLKREADARRDGDRILGLIAGVGLSNDLSGGLLAPSSEGQLRALRAAYAAAGWRPDSVDLIECHATGTPVGDAVELQSLKTLWQDYSGQPGRCVLGSVKSSVGHLLTGAGAAALTKVLFALNEGVLPPTANHDDPVAGLDGSPFRVLRRPEDWPTRPMPRRAAISGFGFGGINAHVLVEAVAPESARTTVAVGLPPSRPVELGIVALEVRLGASGTLQDLRRRLLGHTLPPSARGAAPPIRIPAGRYRIPPRELDELLPQQTLLLETVYAALQPLGEQRPPERTGAFVGVSLDLNTTNYHFRWAVLRADPQLADAAHPALTANRTMGALASIAASRLAREFHIGGPCFTLSAGENSGLAALEAAAGLLARGEIDRAVVAAIDLPCDPREQQANASDTAVVLVVERLADARTVVANPVCVLVGATPTERTEIVSAPEELGYCGAAQSLLALAFACLALQEQVLPDTPPLAWLRDRCLGPRQATVAGSNVLLESEPIAAPPVVREMALRETLFVVEGTDQAALRAGLQQLRLFIEEDSLSPLEQLAADWWGNQGPTGRTGLAVVLLPRDRSELGQLIDQADAHLRTTADQPLNDRVVYSPAPLGVRGQLAFVYPGSGNDFPGMGRELALRWPVLLHRQDAENETLWSQYLPDLFWRTRRPASVLDRLFAQVALGSLVSDLLRLLGIEPQAAIGYSLGESSALFGLRVWRDRDAMLHALRSSTLFVRDLTGPCEAARRAWNWPADQPIDWQTGIVARGAADVRRCLAGLDRAYLQIIHSASECVIGGQREQVQELVRRLGVPLLPVPETTTMHCAVAAPVADAYRVLHRRPIHPVAGLRVYSAGLGRAYAVDPDTVADAIVQQALHPIDFPALIESAYADGVRLFVEVGPGASCSRLIGTILSDRPHWVRSACSAGNDGLAPLYRVLAGLIAHRVSVDLRHVYALAPSGRQRPLSQISAPSLPVVDLGISQHAAVLARRAEAHAAFLHYHQTLQTHFAATLAFQGQLFEQLLQQASHPASAGGADSGRLRGPARPVSEASHPASAGGADSGRLRGPARLDRPACLEFAVGKIGNVLGDRFAAIDAFPTRVRLPDEPLMLVDRILTIEGEPLSLTHGRVVTEHDILPGAWYLDNERIPTCLAVESGQADLFLSGYLGIDLRTRGLAVYRLLDAVVTFHRGLPGPGETIRYDIHIDHFFRQDETYLFRFRFVGTVNGEPLLTMTDGCAGFFTAEELAAGKGVVHTALQRRPLPGVEPQDADILPPLTATERYNERQVDALRKGNLAGCFGPRFAHLPLRQPMRLPGGRMRLVHRVTALEPRGGRFGIGSIRAEADIHPDDWFLTCHFVDDQVMPGTLMYECCLHTLRILLMRLGWVGEHTKVACEPVPGIASRLKCRGQVTAQTRTVTYEVILKERGYRPEPYALCDAHIYADGKFIVDITDMSLRLTGLSRESIAQLWSAAVPVTVPANRLRDFAAVRAAASCAKPLYDRHHILAFATGKPSECFGDRYRLFDEGRMIARLPGPPYCFLDRIVQVQGQPWQMAVGCYAVAQYQVPADEWYFASERGPIMPFAVLLEAALQVCGWMAAYMGSALTSSTDLHFRNLGGDAELLRVADIHSGTFTTQVVCTRVAASAGMIIQDYAFELGDDTGLIYRGTTTFGFFSTQALEQQVGIRDARPYEPTSAERARAEAFDYPRQPPFPDEQLGMIDRVTAFVPDGGPAGLGFLEGTKQVRPEEWFFKAHFYQDPVMPGSLGLEAALQLVKLAAVRRWRCHTPVADAGRLATPVADAGRLASEPSRVSGGSVAFACGLGKHRWLYRGQVIPSNRQIVTQVVITAVDEALQELTADGLLSVDGLVIYRMNDFRVRLVSAPARTVQ